MHFLIKTDEWNLLRQGCKKRNTDENAVYTLRFPVWTHRRHTVIEMIFKIYPALEDDDYDYDLYVDVQTTSNGLSYAPFYNWDRHRHTHHDIVKTIRSEMYRRLWRFDKKYIEVR